MNAALEAFGALIGEWEVAVPQFPGASGRAVFEWLEDGAYLLQRSLAPDPAPGATWIIGADDQDDASTALYHDRRGVSRVYRTSLAGTIWRIWRDAPEFAQRFTGELSEDGETIRAVWELCRDGTTWTHDFDMVYRRVG